jgi:hypothetical protein
VQAILASDPSSQLLSSAISEIRRWCRTSEILPRSCTLAHPVSLGSKYPVSRSALSDVFRGECAGKAVAVKSLRIHVDDVGAVKKVRPFSIRSLASLKPILVVSERSDYMEIPQAPEYRAVPRDIGRL